MIESPDERTPHWQHRQFCAAQLLASIDSPGMPSVDARWEKSADVIAWQLVDACSKRLHHFDRLERSMRPVSKFLVPHLTPYLVPRLMKMFREKVEDVHAGVAVPLLASYTNNDIDARTSFYLVATDSQKEILIKSADELSQNVLWDVVRGNPKIDGIELNGTEQDRRRGLAAALLLARPDTRNSDELWHLLGFSPDPTMRTVLIHDLRATRVPVAKIAIRLQRERDSGIVRSLLQALGEYGADDPDVTGPLRDSITKLFRDDPDSGVHSSSEWLLRRWGDIDTIKRIQKAGSSDHPVGELAGTQWMTTTEGHTLVLIDGKKELAIGRRFLMSTKEVTIGQLLKYDPGKYVNREYGPTDDCPANVVLWKTAHLYCNWLSRAEGLEAVYPVDGEVGSSWLPDFEHLARPGYRLPTAAEWEFACRAGTTTVASIGNDKSYAGKFAWLASDSWNSADQRWISSPVGRLKPNDWGLFDMNGNAAEWCDDFAVGMKRPLLGTNSQSGNDNLDSGYRVEYQPDIDFNRNGFRIVRTVNID